MGENAHLLVVDDDDRLRLLLKKYLSSQGFRVTNTPNAADARKMMSRFHFDLCVLDIMMPGEDGLSLLEDIRRTSFVPVILLTAKDLPTDRIEGLRLGADDYLTKPFEPEELSLRINSILRRARQHETTKEPVHMSGLVFDPERGVLQRGEEIVRLTDSERQLLSILAEKRGVAVERHVLASSGLERSINVQLTRLGRKIEPNPKEPVDLKTVHGKGHRLIPD